jgi:hypothetical protein
MSATAQNRTKLACAALQESDGRMIAAPHKCESRGATRLNAKNQNTNALKFSAKSSVTEAQHDRILDALGSGPKTSHELRCIGIYQVSTRILELRDMGFEIYTARVTLHDRDGYPHPRCALYSLGGTAI